MNRALLAAIAIAVLLACSKTEAPEPEPKPVDKTSPVTSASSKPTSITTTTASAATAPKGPSDLAYDVPASWKSAPNPSPMRKATFTIPKAAGDASDAELAVSAAMGGVDANIDRWAGQFGNATPKKEKRTVNGLAVTIVEIKGPYAGMGQAPQPNQMLLGAIVDGGDQQHFFKMVGPEKTVTAARKDFDAFVASMRAK